MTKSVAATEEPARELSRVARKRERKIRDILDATAEALAASGYHDLSMDDVASRLDLTKATLYHYFSSKDELVASCLRVVGDEVNARLKDIADSPEYETCSDRLRALLIYQATAILTDYSEASHLFVQPRTWPADLSDLIRDLRKTHDDIFRGVIEAGARNGEFIDVDATIVRHCLHGAINYMPVWTKRMSKDARDRNAHAVVDHLMRLVGVGPALSGN